jgi:methyltransferase
MIPLLLAAVAFVPMLLEARRSAANDRVLRASGAIEPRRDVYPIMRVAYPACFLAMIVEAWARDAGPGRPFAAGLLLFTAAKALKYWAIATLGPRWSFRVLVPPGSALVTTGPYRYLRHPNYAGVVGELAGMAVMARAMLTGPAALLVFGTLILLRLRVEARALRPGTTSGGAALRS